MLREAFKVNTFLHKYIFNCLLCDIKFRPNPNLDFTLKWLAINRESTLMMIAAHNH